MDLFSRQELALLIEEPQPPCVSLFLPTSRSGAEAQQGPIRLKTLTHRAEEGLVDMGLRRPDAEEVLRPARALIDDPLFWRYQGDGLAVFLRTGWFRSFRLPIAFEESVTVSDLFHVSPLLPLLTGDGRFFILALSENEARLLAGTRSAVHQINVPHMPSGVKDALRYDDPQTERGAHAGQRGGPGGRVVTHGQGVGAEVQKERLGRYLHIVDDALHEPLHGQRAPLVLAGVDLVRALYREIGSYPHVLEAGIPGSPDRTSPEELHRHAWALVEPVFACDRDAAAAAYREKLGTGLASNSLEEILAAAEAGRVAVLFVRTRTDVAGANDASSGIAQAGSEREPGERDPIDLAAVRTLLTDGTVYAVAGSEMPDREPVAALFRY